jgi:DNA topoisomerase-1
LSKTLVIVESPAKAKSIGKLLGKKYTIKASMGHVRDLPKSQFGVDVEHGFTPKYITIRGKGEIIKELRAAVKKADRVLLASDPDREGEAIAWHLASVLEIDENSPCRIEFNEITRQAVQNAVKEPRPIDYNRVHAQQARRVLDRLVGYMLSPLLWRKVKKGLSAGRVQSVAVRLICDREEEITAFVPEEYWTLTAVFTRRGKDPFEARLYKAGDKKVEIKTRDQVQEILKELRGVSYRVVRITRREKKRQPPLPFTTSSLQQEAYRKLNFTARKTMMVAQQLYEGLELGPEGPVGLVTYIRTDSTRVAAQAVEDARNYIRGKFGPEYVPEKPRQVAARERIQDAHEAIRPTSVEREPEAVKEYLTPDQYKLYKLIWSRFVASQMSPAVVETTSVDIGGGRYIFRASGSVVTFPGFTRVYEESRDDEAREEEGVLPALSEGEALEAESLTPKQHFTQPPPRYTDATLVKALEEKGIGRPSTYAPILETIIRRGYVVREKKQLVPTELGMVVVDLLKRHFPDIIDVEFTAQMEESLDRIEEGEMDWVQVVRDFYGPFQETLARAEEEIGRVAVADEVSEEVCEQCGRNMVIKTGRYGKFLACPGFPECRNTRPLLETTGVPCPRCKKGELVVRRSKKGRRFFGCSRYPECDFMVWDEPAGENCPRCGDMLVVKRGRGEREVLECINEQCRYRVTREKAGSNGEAARDVAAGSEPAEEKEPSFKPWDGGTLSIMAGKESGPAATGETGGRS